MKFIAQTTNECVYTEGGDEYGGGIEVARFESDEVDGEYPEIRIKLQGVGFADLSLEEANQLGFLLVRLSKNEATE